MKYHFSELHLTIDKQTKNAKSSSYLVLLRDKIYLTEKIILTELCFYGIVSPYKFKQSTSVNKYTLTMSCRNTENVILYKYFLYLCKLLFMKLYLLYFRNIVAIVYMTHVYLVYLRACFLS